jgi:predicted ATPase
VASDEVRRLESKWRSRTGWPKFLNWVEIRGIRGWSGQRFEMPFPIMAVVGENGVGKSTVLQCAASLYRPINENDKERFASDFFPETPWDQIRSAEIRCEIKEGSTNRAFALIKPTDRWRRNPNRPQRNVVWVDLSRIQPVPARVGYTRLAKNAKIETSAEAFTDEGVRRLSGIMGRPYEAARMAYTDADPKRTVAVIGQQGREYSGFHQGAGETTIAELLKADLPKYSLVLIDELESSLHPRAQRRLIRDLASKARELELQVVLTTHSPYVLEELPLEARAYILQPTTGTREIVYGVSPEFAMSKMDDVQHYECDLYVEDHRAATMLEEILVAHARSLVLRCRTIPYGAASVGQALGQMAANYRFPAPSCVFLDGDQGSARGCLNLPGEDSPERVVFTDLSAKGWGELAKRIGRDYSQMVDACRQAMTLGDPHEWVNATATPLILGGDILWQAMCAEWANTCLSPDVALSLTDPIQDALDQRERWGAGIPPPPRIEEPEPEPEEPEPSPAPASPSEPPTLFGQWPGADQGSVPQP